MATKESMATKEKDSSTPMPVVEKTSVMDRDDNASLQKDPRTPVINKSSTVIEKETLSGKVSTPVKMYSLPKVFSQSTPPKGLSQSTPPKGLSQSTPPKGLSQSTPPKWISQSSETTPLKETKSSPVTRNDFTNIQSKIDIFCDDLDTEIKACLYSVSVNDTKDVTKCLERLRRRAKAFNGNISFSLDQCVLKSTAVIQKVSSLEQYVKHLRREKDLLQSQVTDLKAQKELQGIEDVLLQSEDDDDDLFSCSPKKAKTEEK